MIIANAALVFEHILIRAVYRNMVEVNAYCAISNVICLDRGMSVVLL